MAAKQTERQLVEVFGHDPRDHSSAARTFWQLNACPFIGKECTKFDHTRTICYGTCSVTNAGQEVVICPNRLYENNYEAIRKVGSDVFGDIPFMLFDEYVRTVASGKPQIDCLVALGHNSGKEVKISQLSMDWVIAHIDNQQLVEYVGIEVQSIDITGNYRDAWYAARDMRDDIPTSGHGLNWANVHKRLIPQIIRKSLVYSKSLLVKNGLHFIVPDPVYQRFEAIIGTNIPLVDMPGKEVIVVHTYDIGSRVEPGKMRRLVLNRELMFDLNEFSKRFISGPNLPTGVALDDKIRSILAVS